MKKIFLLLLMILMISGCGGGNLSELVNDPRQTQAIVIGIDEFAPFGFTDTSGNIVGFDVDLAKEVAARMNVKVKFKIIEWDKKEYELTYGNIDMIWNGCDILEKDRRYMIFSKPYMDNHQVLVVVAGNPKNIHGVKDLAGKIVATQTDASSENYINANEDFKKSFAEFKTYQRISEGFASLKRGELDVLIIDEAAARYEAEKNFGVFEVVDVTVGHPLEYGIGFRRDKTKLRDQVQIAFDKIISDGTAKKISEKWFGVDLIKSAK